MTAAPSRRLPRTGRHGPAAWPVLAALAAPLPAGAAVDLQASEPRAYGHHVGDVIERRVEVTLPAGLVLDPATLPRPERRGAPVELVDVDHQVERDGARQRHVLRLRYQVWVSPPQPRVYETPTFTLQFTGAPRGEQARVEGWPVAVAPLVPVDTPMRRGLGELQPDAPAPEIDAAAPWRRLLLWTAIGTLALGYLGVAYLGLPWWSTRRRPFRQAANALRGLPARPAAPVWHDALQRVHAAVNRTAGRVVLEADLDRFLQAHPRYAAARDDFRRLYAASWQAFYGDGPPAADTTPPDGRWLAGFARRCRDIERGTA